jgi:hypothetical protein
LCLAVAVSQAMVHLVSSCSRRSLDQLDYRGRSVRNELLLRRVGMEMVPLRHQLEPVATDAVRHLAMRHKRPLLLQVALDRW